MKIVLINDNHSRVGGAEHYFFDLKERLQQVPDISVFSIGFGPKNESGPNYRVFKAPQSNLSKLFWRIMPQPVLYFRLRRELKKLKPDVIHLHNIKQFSLTTLSALKPYPIVQTMHDYGQICPISYNIHQDYQPCATGLRRQCFWKHRLKFDLIGYTLLALSFLVVKQKLKQTVNHYFAPSPQLVNYLQKNNFQPTTLMLPFQSIPQDVSFTHIDPYHFLFVGNLVNGKGIHTLIEEFHLAYQINKKITLTIVGAGQAQRSIQNKIEELGLSSQITLTGWQTNLASYYNNCAALIFPSIWMESFGLVITEAMGHARPVIGSNHETTKWLVEDEVTGLIFNPMHKGELAERILRLAGDAIKIERYGQAARKKLEQLIDNNHQLAIILQTYRAIRNKTKLHD